MNANTYKYYLRDLIYIIKERKSELKSDKNKSDFDSGIEYGYLEIISIIENQALSFNLDFKAIGFEDYENYEKKKNIIK